ncbi:putative phenylalanine--tRNA ligase alpha subunit [Capsicum baccatum]|uniref:Phenylalanine--tRNA ligase alpha subunit n=1 Tax=Capsicum baccatum TaxID=33114 RepID=A0A2G2VK31_CAPBA|nr:putative phenylalanine--tRNA ligase alpha subunit [Capsicum baccatum]
MSIVEMEKKAILAYLEKEEEISNSENFAKQFGFSHEEILNVIRRLHGFKFVEAKDIRRERWVLTEEGETYAAVGSPEFQLFSAVPPEGTGGVAALIWMQKKLDPAVYKIGWQQALKNKWVQMKTDVPMRDVSRKVQPADDKVKDLLLRIQNNEAVNKEDIDALKRRKLIIQQVWKGNSVRKGPKYAPIRKRAATDLTRENLQRFEEMPTNNYVESSFWNFDALFQPQQHPARDSHDTFFLKVPSTTKMLPEDYFERVKEIHESGGYQSRGYGLILPILTSVSLTLVKVLTSLYSVNCAACLDMGMSKLRFKPAYNPYTEPSMEIFSFKKWVEVGNSGMFRPEMLLPMGLPEDVRVIAWGLSLERPTMILYGIDNIRDLFGSKVDLSLIKRNPICRLGL